jgi:hypothetical protein
MTWNSDNMNEEEITALKLELNKHISQIIKSPNFTKNTNIFINNLYHFALHGSENINTILDVAEKVKADKRKAITCLMASYLWTYESIYVLAIDGLCYLLCLGGHDLFDANRKDYVSSYDDIKNVDIYSKTKFLKNHNFNMVERKEDRLVRNKIAHHDFDLDSSGVLRMANKEVNICSMQSELLSFSRETLNIITECLNEEAQKIEAEHRNEKT